MRYDLRGTKVPHGLADDHCSSMKSPVPHP
jgi:hypothetical protein